MIFIYFVFYIVFGAIVCFDVDANTSITQINNTIIINRNLTLFNYSINISQIPLFLNNYSVNIIERNITVYNYSINITNITIPVEKYNLNITNKTINVVEYEINKTKQVIEYVEYDLYKKEISNISKQMEDMKIHFLFGMILLAIASIYGQKILDQFKK
jgi:hypothetical protein